MSTSARVVLFVALAGLAACSAPPAREPRSLQAPRAVVFGPPARPGIDGPVGITELDTPAPVWMSTDAATTRTTAELMDEAARRPPTFSDWRQRPHPRKHRPSRRALPQDPAATSSPQREPATLTRGGAPLVAQTAATPNADVATLSDTNSLPPDTMGDVGPTQYLVGLNGRFRTIDKTTGAPDGALNMDSDAFFAGVVPAGHFTSDPRVRFDRRLNRWIVLMISVGVPNRFLVAVSDTATISGGTIWSRFSWANTRTAIQSGGVVSCLADYPTLGVDEDALYIGVNQFCGPDANSLAFDSTSVYVVNKQALANGTLSVAQFNGVLPDGSSNGIYTPQGVDNFDGNTNEGYVIGVDGQLSGRLVMRRVINPGGTPSLSNDIVITVAQTAYPIDVSHPGGTLPLDGLDDRLLQAVVRNGRLWTTHQLEVNGSGVATVGGGRNGVRWYEIQNLASTPSVRQSGTIFDSAVSNPRSYFMGAIVPNGQGHVSVGMTVAGAATRVNTAFSGRLAGDALNTMDAPTQYSANTAFSYNRQSAPDSAQRWGDYSFTSVDPADDQTFWTLQQYVNGTDSYAVRLVKLLAPGPATLSAGAVSPSTVTAGLGAVNVTVTGTATGGRGFFDPGAGFARRIAASFGAGVTVTNVVVNSATSLTLTLNTVGATVGARTLTVTNPDGQTSTLASALTVGAAVPGPPAFTNVPGNQQIFDAGAGTGATATLPFLVVDPDGTPVQLTATSSNPAVIPDTRIQLTPPDGLGNAAVRVVSSGQFGSSTITLRAESGGQFTTATFVVTVSQSTVAGAPQNLAALVTRNRITFTWGAPASAGVEPVSSYRIEAGFGPGQTAAVLPAGNVTSYTVFAAPDGVFFVRVRAQTAAGLSAASNEIQIATGQAAPPLAPQALLATVQGTSIALQWTENPNGPVIGAYYLLAGSAPGLADIGVLPLPATARTFVAAAPPGTYYVRIAAVNAAGTGAPSNEAVLVAQPSTCTIPAPPTGAVVSQTSRRITFAWNPPASGAIPATYQIEAGTAAGLSNIGVFPVAGNVFAVSGLVSPGPYFLRVAAVNACGASTATADVSVTVP